MPQLPEGSLFKIKTALYSVAAICVFLGWALTIAVFTQGGQVGGATKYYFFMVGRPSFFWEAFNLTFLIDLDINTGLRIRSGHTTLPSYTKLR